MNTVNYFEKNLKVFERFCPELVEEVKNANCENYEFLKSESGDLNIRKKSENGDFYFHSKQNPKKEADIWFNSLYEIEDVDIIIVFGIGLGHYYYPCKEWLEKDPQRLIIFIEHDFSLLNMFFQTQQAEEILADTQVAIIGTKSNLFEGIEVKLDYLEIIALLLPEHYSQFSELKSYSKIYYQFWKKIKKTLQFYATETTINTNFFKPKTLQESVINGIRNYWSLPGSKLFYALKGCLKGVPAVICGAGPSLHDDLPFLKNYKDHALIMGAGTGMNILNKNDFIPPLGVVVDPYDATRSRILTNYAYEVPFCYMSSVNNEALKLVHGTKVFFRGRASYDFDAYFENQLGLGKYPLVYSPLSTTHVCLGIAAMLGCNPIILLGVDLAYTDRKRYPDAVKDHPLDKSIEHFHPSGLHHQQIITSKGTEGNLVETRMDWIREASLFENFDKIHPEVRLINATSRGLLIPGLPSVDVKEIVQSEFKCVYDLENLIHAEIQNCPKVKATKKEVEEVMVKWNESLETSKRLLSDIVEELSRFLKRLKEDPDLLEEDYQTQTLSVLKEKLHSEDVYHYFLHFEEVEFLKIFFRRRYPMLYRPEQFEKNEKSIKEIEFEIGLYLFLIYFLQIMKDEVEASLKNERCQRTANIGESKSEKEIESIEDVPPNNDVYVFEDDKLIIHDEELNLHWEEKFIPETIPSDRKFTEENLFHYSCIKENKPEGQCKVFYQSGKTKGECFYKEGKIHGPSTYYSEEGKILARGWFIENKRQGKNYQYYPSGRFFSIKRYKDGESHGKQEYFYESGGKKTTMCFIKGKLEGSVRLYYPGGELKREIHFKNGALNGFERMWDINGQLILESEYLNNQPTGFSRSWYPSGQIKQEKKYYDSAESYDLKGWNEDGEIIESKIFMPEGIKNGLLSKAETTRLELKNMKERLRQLEKNNNPKNSS